MLYYFAVKGRIMDYSKYHRNKPIKEFDVNQTMYSMIESESKDSLDLNATGFLGNSMTYKELFDVSDKLASAFLNSGVSLNDNVAILTISMPIVQEALLALSKIGATMSWIDLRTKPKDLIKYINNSNSKAIIVFEDILPLVKETIDETDVKKVIVVSPKDYLSPVVKVLATLKDMKENKKTNAARLLDQKGIAYELIAYPVDENDLGAEHIAESLQEPIERVFKTILVRGDKTGPIIGVVPGNLDMNVSLAINHIEGKPKQKR